MEAPPALAPLVRAPCVHVGGGHGRRAIDNNDSGFITAGEFGKFMRLAKNRRSGAAVAAKSQALPRLADATSPAKGAAAEQNKEPTTPSSPASDKGGDKGLAGRSPAGTPGRQSPRAARDAKAVRLKMAAAAPLVSESAKWGVSQAKYDLRCAAPLPASCFGQDSDATAYTRLRALQPADPEQRCG